MSMDFDKVKDVVMQNYMAARKNLKLFQRSLVVENSQAISDVVPGYKAKELEFGSYDRDNFCVMFIDIRKSTERAKILGPDKTYLSYHAFFPALACIIEHYKGYVIDFMGDGIMAFFGGKNSEMAHAVAAQNAGLCGIDIQKAIKMIVNPLIQKDDIHYIFNCGVGIDHGDVIVTKIGNSNYYDVKAFGDCINKASKLSDGEAGTVQVSSKIKELWPSSKGGLISFKPSKMENCYLIYKQDTSILIEG